MTDDLTTRLLATIEAEAQRDTHDRECLLFSNANDGWCDKGCRERTERHYVAHRKIVADCAHVLQAIEEVLSRPHSERDEFGGIYLARELATKVLASVAVAYDLTTEPAP